MNMRTILFSSVVLLTSCATTQGPQPLRTMYHVADDWVVAAYDEKSNVHIHARQLQPVPYSNKPGRIVNQYMQLYVQPGDTIQSIAERAYDDPYKWDLIAMANNIESPYRVEVGATLDIPLPIEHEATGKVVDLDQWEMRFVNSGTTDVCAKIEFMDIDYFIDVKPGWYHLPAYETLYVGKITQEPWVLAQTLHTFSDAKWVVNTIKVVPYKSETECAI